LVRIDSLAGSVTAFVVFYGVLTLLYSIAYMRKKPSLGAFYSCVAATTVISAAAVLVDNLVLFVVLWGLLALLLYLLVNLGSNERAPQTAKKTFIIIGGTDSLMLLGLALLWQSSGAPNLAGFAFSAVNQPIASGASAAAYLLLLTGALAKAGAMPFHTWVPDAAEDAPLPAAAFLPASLDKLLGIYFLMRLNLDLFALGPLLHEALMLIGSVTILAGVMMALAQHDLRRLLGYHAVSQVGYMVLGIGVGTPLGIAGGLFHMFNNTLYKAGLFFSSGAVINDAGHSDLDKLGGYAKRMPVTFGAFLVFSLAIAGVPPLNGFVSKWMIYQSLFELGREGGVLWALWLAAAIFGSALTLASFMKLLYAVFLAPPREARTASGEGSALLWAPSVLLAALCAVFGVFAFMVPLRWFVIPSVGAPVEYAGDWRPLWATLLLAIAFALGGGICLLGKMTRTRSVEPFAGGERVSEHPEMRVSAVDVYRTVEQVPFLTASYAAARRKLFDVYDVGAKGVLGVSRFFSSMHNGELATYIAWCLLGMIVMFLAIMKWPA
jgi:formate hydrogenlyase subunit 3/multisubunit Na+/H+ antiporter MnhD subunit